MEGRTEILTNGPDKVQIVTQNRLLQASCSQCKHLQKDIGYIGEVSPQHGLLNLSNHCNSDQLSTMSSIELSFQNFHSLTSSELLMPFFYVGLSDSLNLFLHSLDFLFSSLDQIHFEVTKSERNMVSKFFTCIGYLKIF